MNNIKGSLIQFNLSKLKHYPSAGLKAILKIILKLLTALLIALRKGYLRLRKFAKAKHRGSRILFLIFLFILIFLFFFGYIKKEKKTYQKLQQKYENQLEEYQDLMEQKYELEKKSEDI